MQNQQEGLQNWCAFISIYGSLHLKMVARSVDHMAQSGLICTFCLLAAATSSDQAMHHVFIFM